MAKIGFLDKTLLAIARLGEQALFSEQSALQQGLLQRIDVRVKLLTFAFLLILISISRTPAVLWVFTVVGIVLALLSRVPLGPFLQRVSLFGPVFTALFAFPALFNIITPGDPVLTLFVLPSSYSWGPYVVPRDLTITHQGIAAVILIVSRVTASVSIAVLLTVTTRWHDIFAGLRALFVPRVFVMTLSMTYRYVFVFLRVIQDMYRARKSRTIHAGTASLERSWVASRIGFLFKRSTDMSSSIYLAMVSRGYHGEIITVNRFRLSAADVLWTLGVVVAGCAGIAWERGVLP